MEDEKELAARPGTDAGEESERQEPERGIGAGRAPAESLPAPAETPNDPAAAYQKVLAEKQELYDRLLRKQAELENVRKRILREKEEFLQHATVDLIRALLPALDAFERALKQRESGVPEKFYEGMGLIFRQLLEVLGRAGLTPVETSGKLFDPHLHQAVEAVEAPGYRDQEIVEELQRGYKLRHRLLRPAIVKVAVPRKKDHVPSADSDKPSPQN